MNWLTGFHAVEEALAAGRALDRIVILPVLSDFANGDRRLCFKPAEGSLSPSRAIQVYFRALRIRGELNLPK